MEFKNITLKKLIPFKFNMEESQILFIYRYLSLFIASTFYLLNQSQHSFIRKAFIIGCLFISSVILSYLYLINEKSEQNIKILIIIETICNSILLIPSGGINSPFVWYTLNTILISSVFLKRIYCWINLLIYILASTVLSYLAGDSLSIKDLMRNESNFIFGLIMVLAAIQVWSMYVKKIKDKNKALEELNVQLELSNETVMESIDYIKSLYQSINILTNKGNKEGLIKLVFRYAKEITKSNILFYYDISNDNNKMITYGNDDYLMDLLEKNIDADLDDILENKLPIEISVLDTNFVMMPVRTIYKNYGILGCEITNNKESVIHRNNIQQIQFLSELMSITFERLYLEGVNERLLISEEQNRIANEIHDSVLQRLFSLSCGIFALLRRIDEYGTDDIKEELNFIRKTIDAVMKELRSKIYGLSWKKSGCNSFVNDIKSYIDETKRLNNVSIPFSITGNDELLSHEQKKSIYRMICEGIGNAVHHGQAKNIEVSLNIEPERSILNIIDDGIGFDVEKIKEDNTAGIGIRNMQQLSELQGGNMTIESKLGMGTWIEITIPTNGVLEKGEEVSI